VLRDVGVTRLDAAQKRELNRAWHRLPAWPDAVAGLTRLKSKYIVCTLSNGNIGLLTEMAKRAGLPWDCVLSAEVFKAYKPDPRTYLGVAGGVRHRAASGDAGGRTPRRPGRGACLRPAHGLHRASERVRRAQPKDVSPQAGNDLHVSDIGALADRLGC
jgi:2-haloacid dehalogenase